ncbi:MAG: hypothetical protein QXP98_00225 [Thermoproteus sp.]
MIYGKQHVFWLIYGTDFDLPAVLAKLVGLGYEIARSGYREGYVYLDPLPGGYAARRVYEEGEVRLLANLQRGALGVVAEEHQLMLRGVADVFRALSELKIGEPPRVELHVTFGFVGSLKESGEIDAGDLKLKRAGLYATYGDPHTGDGVLLSISPLGPQRYMAYVLIGGRWEFVIGYARRVWELASNILKSVAEGV